MKIIVVYFIAVLCLGLPEASESCNTEIVVGSSFTNISSPGYPLRPYPRLLNCWWKIVTQDIDSNVVVEVLDSIIESSENCTNDYLSFHDGYNSSAPVLGKICGSTRGIYISSGNKMFIQFRTDTDIGRRGFLLKVDQTPKCGGELTAKSDNSILNSPGYNNTYFNNLHCVWLITTENETDTVVLEVINSDIEDQTSCLYDSVTIYNGNASDSDVGALLGTYCGSDQPSFHSSQNQLRIVFKTDSSVVKAGFSMRFRSVPVGNCNMTMLAGHHPLYFVSPGFPDTYYNDMECVWLIVSNNYILTDNLLLTVVSDDIEESVDCSNDSVTVYQGIDPERNLGTFCGNMTPVYRSTMGFVTVVFRSGGDVTGGSGFKIKYQLLSPTITTTPAPTCGPTSLNALTTRQYLHSPGYPGLYQNNEQCLWTITAANPSMMVRIVVVDSQLEDASSCQYDYVKVFDGPNAQYNLIQIWCGDMTPTVQSSSSALSLLFHTDSSNVFRGFRLYYYETTARYTCGGSLMASALGKLLTSPGYPELYQNNMNCVWTITAETGTNIKIDVLETDIEFSSTCQYDYVEVDDGSSSSSTKLGKFCGSQTPTYYSSGGTVTITFHTDNSNVARGFKLQYTAGTFNPCSEKDLVAYTFIDYIQSPNYPNDYPNNADCTWRIDTEDSDFVVTLDVLTSNIEYSSSCSYDYVEAFDGYDDGATSLGKWCGYDVPTKHSSGRYMFIRFKTDSSNTRTGFRMSYTATLRDTYYSINVVAVVGGTVGGIVFIAIIAVVVAAANRKPSRPVVTRVGQNRTPGNIYTVSQGPYETSVTPAVFQPPPPYTQVVSAEQSRPVGSAAPPPAYTSTVTTSDTAPLVNQQEHSQTGS